MNKNLKSINSIERGSSGLLHLPEASSSDTASSPHSRSFSSNSINSIEDDVQSHLSTKETWNGTKGRGETDFNVSETNELSPLLKGKDFHSKEVNELSQNKDKTKRKPVEKKKNKSSKAVKADQAQEKDIQSRASGKKSQKVDNLRNNSEKSRNSRSLKKQRKLSKKESRKAEKSKRRADKEKDKLRKAYCRKVQVITCLGIILGVFVYTFRVQVAGVLGPKFIFNNWKSFLTIGWMSHKSEQRVLPASLWNSAKLLIPIRIGIRGGWRGAGVPADGNSMPLRIEDDTSVCSGRGYMDEKTANCNCFRGSFGDLCNQLTESFAGEYLFAAVSDSQTENGNALGSDAPTFYDKNGTPPIIAANGGFVDENYDILDESRYRRSSSGYDSGNSVKTVEREGREGRKSRTQNVKAMRRSRFQKSEKTTVLE
eukprot:g3299.t1